jgi:hypothetical protein
MKGQKTVDESEAEDVWLVVHDLKKYEFSFFSISHLFYKVVDPVIRIKIKIIPITRNPG